MNDWFWLFRSKRCAICNGGGAAIELTVRYAGDTITNKWFCTYRHLKEWWDKEYVGAEERTKVIVVKK